MPWRTWLRAIASKKHRSAPQCAFNKLKDWPSVQKDFVVKFGQGKKLAQDFIDYSRVVSFFVFMSFFALSFPTIRLVPAIRGCRNYLRVQYRIWRHS